jgi:ligand-binding SRPBCC domain-containing protein
MAWWFFFPSAPLCVSAVNPLPLPGCSIIPAMAHFTRSIQIAAPPEAVFDFHADPRNIVKVAAPPVQARLLEPYDVPLRQGSIVRLRVVLLGMLPQLWESEIVVCGRPNEFVDEQRRGPFGHWRHRHLFRPSETGTELTDDVDYELSTALPFRLMGAEAMTRTMENLFARRLELTKQLIEDGVRR